MVAKSGFVAYVQVLSLISSVLTVGVGIAHLSVVLTLSNWCQETEDVTCIGPALRWIQGSNPVQDSNGANGWRSVFTIAPDSFLENGTPLIFGLLGVFLHFPSLRINRVIQSWMRMAAFFVFNAIFCNLGYAGNFGIIVGFFSVFVAFNCLIIRFSGERTSPTTMDFLAGSTNEDGTKKSAFCCRSFFTLPLDDVILAVARLSATCVACLTIILGVIHIFNAIGVWCDSRNSPDGVYCVGPWLGFRTSFPNGALDFFSFQANPTTTGNSTGGGFIGTSADINGKWRSVFAITPSSFFELFCPVVCGSIVLAAHSPTLRIDRLVGSWSRLWIFELFIAVFANFGYAGNLGVVTGFLSVFVAAMAFVIICSDRRESSPFLDVSISFQITDAGDQANRSMAPHASSNTLKTDMSDQETIYRAQPPSLSQNGSVQDNLSHSGSTNVSRNNSYNDPEWGGTSATNMNNGSFASLTNTHSGYSNSSTVQGTQQQQHQQQIVAGTVGPVTHARDAHFSQPPPAYVSDIEDITDEESTRGSNQFEIRPPPGPPPGHHDTSHAVATDAANRNSSHRPVSFGNKLAAFSSWWAGGRNSKSSKSNGVGDILDDDQIIAAAQAAQQHAGVRRKKKKKKKGAHSKKKKRAPLGSVASDNPLSRREYWSSDDEDMLV